MTILFLISSEGYYGAENMLVALARQLSNQGCQCVIGVFCNSHSPHMEVGERAQQYGLQVEFVSCSGRWDWKAVTQVRKLLVKHKVDILHPHGYKADLYAYAASWRNRVALVATVHNWPSRTLTMRAYAALDRLVLKGFDRVVAVSGLVADLLRRWGVAQEKVSTISNGVDLARFQGAQPVLRRWFGLEGHALVGFVGRLVPDKGGAVLLDAARRVLARNPMTKFVFVGGGPSRTEWELLAIQLGIAEQVYFAGVRDDMPSLYASMDMVVLPSFVESMPMCLLEAMAAGRPVIATRVGAIPMLVVPEHTGLLIEPGDVSGLSTAILRLLEDTHLARQLGENGQVHVARNYSVEVMAKSYIEQYACLSERRGNVASNLVTWQPTSR